MCNLRNWPDFYAHFCHVITNIIRFNGAESLQRTLKHLKKQTHDVVFIEPVPGRIRPMARDKEVTPAVEQELLLLIPLSTVIHKDDMLPLFQRSLSNLRIAGVLIGFLPSFFFLTLYFCFTPSLSWLHHANSPSEEVEGKIVIFGVESHLVRALGTVTTTLPSAPPSMVTSHRNPFNYVLNNLILIAGHRHRGN